MMGLPESHPFYVFNEYLYMESGTPKLPIYLWKKGNKGILVELHLNDKESGPRGKVYELSYDDEYYFELGKLLRNVVGYSNIDDLLNALAEIIQKELKKL